MKIADVSIRRPVFAFMMIGALVVFGLFSYPRIGVDLMPEVEFPFVSVTVIYPGADPAAMESKVADPIEEKINTMSGIKMLRSANLESVTQIFVQFELDVDLESAVQDVRDRIASIQRDLPSGIEPPVISKFDTGAVAVMSVALSSDMPIRELTKFADEVVKDRLQKVTGVGSVDLVGGREREIHVLVDPARLSGLGYTVEDVANALRAGNIELPAGRIEDGNHELTVKTKGEVRTTGEIANIIISGLGGAVVRISDVASVEDGAEEARSASALNGQAAVSLLVRKQSGANTVAVADGIRAEVEALRPLVESKGVKLAIPMDTSDYIRHSIADVQFDIMLGAILAVVIIMLFLADFRATIISAITIPSSLIATLAFMDFMGFTFNIVTMLGMSLSIGILIDDAIVVIENIHRHKSMGKGSVQAASEATGEIGLAVLATSASICAVFVPIAFMKGIIGRFFYQFGLTVSFTILVSTLIALTLTPMLASRFLKGGENDRPFILFRGVSAVMDWLNRGYRRLLVAALNQRLITLGIAIAAFVGAIFVVQNVKSEFMPTEDRSEFMVNIELPTGSSLATSQGYVETMAADIRENCPGVTQTFMTIGGGAAGQVNQGQIHVLLTPWNERPYHQTTVMAWIRARYADITDVTIAVAEFDPMASEAGFRSQEIQYNIRGRNLDELIAAANQLVARLGETPGFVDLDTTYREGKPELSIEIDRDRAAALGVPVAAIATTIRALIAGDKVTELKEGLDIYEVTIELPGDQKSGFEKLANLEVRAVTGQLVDLANVVKVTRTTGPSQIEREKRQRQVTVLANLEGLPLGEAQKQLDAIAAEIIPENLNTAYTGMVEIMQESFGYMMVALLLAIIFVYMVLAAQFNSFIHPFTIMLSLPLSVVGAFGALFLSGMTLNMFSFIGFILLMGLVTKNGILLVDYTNTMREQGMGVREALLTAGPVRLRPILMTTCAMIGGMLPVALALGAGGEARAPMAMAVIGGLITSTLLTLVVIPVVYSLFDGVTKSRPIQWIGGLVFTNGNDTLAPATAAPAGTGHAALSPAYASNYQAAENPPDPPPDLNHTEVIPADHLPPDPGPTSAKQVPDRSDGDPDNDDEPPPSAKKTLIGGYE